MLALHYTEAELPNLPVHALLQELVWVLFLTVSVKSRSTVSRMGHLAWPLFIATTIAGWSSIRLSAFLRLMHHVTPFTCKADDSLLWGMWAVLFCGGGESSPWCPYWNKQTDFLLSLEVNLPDVVAITCSCHSCLCKAECILNLKVKLNKLNI